MKRSLLSILFLYLILLVGCGGGSSNPPPPPVVTLVSIAVTPGTASIAAKATQQFSATGTYSDGTTKDLSTTSTWQSSDMTVATISSTGLATGVGPGTANITASSGTVSSLAAAVLTVNPAALVSISVTPATATINPTAPGNMQQFTATGTYGDGTTNDLTATATWQSSDSTIAAISAAGLASAVAPGTVTITATSGTVSGTAMLSVDLRDVSTYNYNVFRQGQTQIETILTPSNVNSSLFGEVGFFSVDGKVDGQPLYANNMPGPLGTQNTLFVVTEHDSIYAFDADSGTQTWKASALPAGETPSDDRGCGTITPEIGITDTPVFDRQRGPNGALYFVAMSKDSNGKYHQRLHALDMKTGIELFGGPTEIQATYPGTGAGSQGGFVIFVPRQYAERAGLLADGGNIYLGFTSHCDQDPYTGWLLAYDMGTLKQTAVLDITPNGSEGAIWMSGGGLASDGNGFLYFLAADGTFDVTLDANGFPINGDYGNAFMKVAIPQLKVADYFTMHNTVQESIADKDLGSGGALILPPLTDANGQVHHLAVGAGKDTNMYVVDRDNMGKFNPNNDSAVYQKIVGALPFGVWAVPAYFNNTVYYGALDHSLKAFSISNAKLSTLPTSQTLNTFPYPGTLPTVSASGVANGIVWAVENSDPAVLHAYDATDLSQELYNSNQAGSRDQFGPGNKFISPVVVNGQVFVGTQNGVAKFGLLP